MSISSEDEYGGPSFCSCIGGLTGFAEINKGLPRTKYLDDSLDRNTVLAARRARRRYEATLRFSVSDLRKRQAYGLVASTRVCNQISKPTATSGRARKSSDC